MAILYPAIDIPVHLLVRVVAFRFWARLGVRVRGRRVLVVHP
jgi:hypothetical protein